MSTGNPQSVEWGRGKFLCPRCHGVYKPAEKAADSPYCLNCDPVVQNEKNAAVVSTALATAARDLLSINPEHRGGVRADLAMRSFIDKIGGEAGLGEKLGERLEKILNDPLATSKEQRIWLFQTMKFAQKQQEIDQGKQMDLSGLSEDDLMALLLPLAVKMVTENAEFRAEVLRKAGIDIELLEHDGSHVSGVLT